MKKKLFFIFILATLNSCLLAQSNYVSVVDTFKISPVNNYKISRLNIIPFSESVFLNCIQLKRNQYRISYQTGYLSLTDSTNYSAGDLIVAAYKSITIDLKTEFKNRSLVIKYDDLYADSIRVIKVERVDLSAESIFGRELQKSGALIRGFTLGSNRDFQLHSGLRLQLAGKLSDELDIVAALSDENTPILPEGNTETLEELDKVFIEVKHKNAVGTFGDYELNYRENEFSQITRKLQGLKGEFNFDNHSGFVAIAGSRGKFNTNQFYGLDGNQGPYRLFGSNNERLIIIIAGSERVYLDGELLKRGENNDYVIDYSNSEIVFTPKRLITSASRISIDFEYTDQKYRRNFIGTNYSSILFDEKLKLGISYLREGDDQHNPIELSFSESDLEILRNAGANRFDASISGVSIAQPDTSGRRIGIYTKVDTLINSQSYSYYRYSPGNINSIYNVSFSFVGQGNGDYIKESLGRYKFAGIGYGSYLPVIFLPLPELKQIGNFSVKTNIIQGTQLDIELSGSSWDRNRFSAIDNSDSFGFARNILFTIEPLEIDIGNISFGKFGFSIRDRFIQGRYTSLDRIDEVEFSRYYNVSDVQKSDQTLREISLSLFPAKSLSVISKYGYLKQGDQFTSNRINSLFKFREENKIDIDYNVDYVSSRNYSVVTNWNRQTGKGFYSFGIIKPGINFFFEDKEDYKNDSLLSTSLKYVELAPFVEVSASNNFDLRALYSYREESFPLNYNLALQSRAYTQQFQINYKGLKEFTSSLNVSFRNKKFTDEFKKTGNTDNETILFLSQSRFNFFNNSITGDLFYKASTEQSARLEKVFVKVPRGTGSYIYLGDLNSNGIPEENEFQLTSFDGEFVILTIPTDQLFPVIDLKINTRWRIDFNKIVSSNDFLSDILKALSTETVWRVEENSKESNTSKIYLMHLGNFLNHSTTIRGSQFFQQDINILQFNSNISIRLRFLQRRNLNQFSAGIEKGFFRERGIRVRIKLLEEINNQTEFLNQVDNLLSPPSSNRARQVDQNSIVTEFNYRPISNVETGLKIQVGRSEDTFPQKPTVIDQNSITLRVNLSLANIGRLRIEAERTELNSNSAVNNIPFEITRGNVIGKNYFWRVFFDYKIAGYVQTSVSYDGRLYGKQKPINTLRAEARAYF
ncbi:MAG: hypothetical protein AB1432_09350 [Bacteroidota bacterium]